MGGTGSTEASTAVLDADWYPALDRAVDRALAVWKEPGTPLTVLFSGGVDSGLLAWELRNRDRTTLFTVGVPGAPDLTVAEAAARVLGLPWRGSAVGPADLAESARSWRTELDRRPPGLRGLHLALAVAIERSPPGAILCGQGIDELFLGYAHFRGLTDEAATVRAAADLKRLQEEDWPATQRLADRSARRLEAPFLDPAFISAAVAVPIARRSAGRPTKAFWRGWAAHRGLPPEIGERPKRAMQYGSGIDRWYRSRLSRS